jgi:hypothetical protein
LRNIFVPEADKNRRARNHAGTRATAPFNDLTYLCVTSKSDLPVNEINERAPTGTYVLSNSIAALCRAIQRSFARSLVRAPRDFTVKSIWTNHLARRTTLLAIINEPCASRRV